MDFEQLTFEEIHQNGKIEFKIPKETYGVPVYKGLYNCRYVHYIYLYICSI